jgi:hypothetical protein
MAAIEALMLVVGLVAPRCSLASAAGTPETPDYAVQLSGSRCNIARPRIATKIAASVVTVKRKAIQ